MPRNRLCLIQPPVHIPYTSRHGKSIFLMTSIRFYVRTFEYAESLPFNIEQLLWLETVNVLSSTYCKRIESIPSIFFCSLVALAKTHNSNNKGMQQVENQQPKKGKDSLFAPSANFTSSCSIRLVHSMHCIHRQSIGFKSNAILFLTLVFHLFVDLLIIFCQFCLLAA